VVNVLLVTKRKKIYLVSIILPLISKKNYPECMVCKNETTCLTFWGVLEKHASGNRKMKDQSHKIKLE